MPLLVEAVAIAPNVVRVGIIGDTPEQVQAEIDRRRNPPCGPHRFVSEFYHPRRIRIAGPYYGRWCSRGYTMRAG